MDQKEALKSAIHKECERCGYTKSSGTRLFNLLIKNGYSSIKDVKDAIKEDSNVFSDMKGIGMLEEVLFYIKEPASKENANASFTSPSGNAYWTMNDIMNFK